DLRFSWAFCCPLAFAGSRTSVSLWLFVARPGAIRSSSLTIWSFSFRCSLLTSGTLRSAFAGSQTKVSLWLTAMPGVIRPSSLTIASFDLHFSWASCCTLGFADSWTSVSLWLVTILSLPLGAIRSSSLTIWSLGLGSCLDAAVFESCFNSCRGTIRHLLHRVREQVGNTRPFGFGLYFSMRNPAAGVLTRIQENW